MAGHNKWSQIKRKKAVNDRQRGKVISKHIRAIQSAVRAGGSGDASANLPLKNALAAAKSDNVPVDNIDRAIERAVGGADGGNFEEVLYEGYGPAGVAMLVEALTDNKNRTVAEVRHAFSKHGGNLSGSTAWQFDTKGLIVVEDPSDGLEELAIDLGADDIEMEDGVLTVYTEPTALYELVEGFQARGVEPAMAQLTRVPQTQTPIDEDDVRKVLNLMDSLEELDDVQNVYSTADGVEFVG
ncbi:MAG TPA: YebC/PmpR family DNA-binding transcriptional regulator [Trueperaceae bacterium]|nr:YebC/PmpR family DNA-binding transcriptional regulator [Trueperaceae bacterium]